MLCIQHFLNGFSTTKNKIKKFLTNLKREVVISKKKIKNKK